MAKRRTDEQRLLELIREKDAAYEVIEALERRGLSEAAAGDLLWDALRAGALGAKWREGLFSWRSPYLEAMARAARGFDVADLASLFEQLALALGEVADTSDASSWDRWLDQMIASCAGDRRVLLAAHGKLAEPGRARVGAALTRAGVLAPRRDERAALLRHAAECVLYGGDDAFLETVGEAERSRLILEAASRRDDARRYLISNVEDHLPRATEEELVGIGIRAWGAQPVHEELEARGEAARGPLEAEAARLLEREREAEDEDWIVVVTARLASLYARRGEPFPDRLRPLIERSIALSRAPRKTLSGPRHPRENPFYAFAHLARLLSPDEAIDLALRCFQVRVTEALAVFTPLGDALLPALAARARGLLAAKKPALSELAVIVLGLGRILLARGEGIDPDLDPLLGALVAAADDLVPREVRAKCLVHDPSRDDGDTRALVAAVLNGISIERREALLAKIAKVPFYFFGCCPTPAFAERAIARVAALDEDDARIFEPNIRAALAALGPAALEPLIAALDEKRLPARALLAGALADLAAPAALARLARLTVDPLTAPHAVRGLALLDPVARREHAEEALAARDRVERTMGALVLETLPPSPEVAARARELLGAERAKGVREVLERIVIAKRGGKRR